MSYFSTTRETASWLLASSRDRELVTNHLHEIEALVQLRNSILVIGPIRVAASDDGETIGLWNTEYLSASGGESWGFIRLSGPFGLLDDTSMLNETFERCLYVVAQRLQGLLLDDRMIHRANPNGAHTCLAGRGTKARQQSISYLEQNKAVLCLGPGRDLDRLAREAVKEHRRLSTFREVADNLVNTVRLRPALESSIFKDLESRFLVQEGGVPSQSGPTAAVPELGDHAIPEATAYATLHWTYDDWISPTGGLTTAQRQILESDIVLSQPLRIVGAAGSGKTLLMQLLAIRLLKHKQAVSEACKLFYVVHNSAMKDKVLSRFTLLGAEGFLQTDSPQCLNVSTLFDFSLNQLQVEQVAVVDKDAMATKQYQARAVAAALDTVLNRRATEISSSDLFRQITQSEELLNRFAELLVIEIGIAIKGRNLVHNPKLYIEAEQPLSRLHAVLPRLDREIVYDTFEEYQREALDAFEVLDSDDIAITLLARLRTPLWQMKRRSLGYDYVFVDETQLFNENERRILPLLLKGSTTYTPIALAMDSAQEIAGSTSAGFGAIGIESIAERELRSVHRSTRSILSLAFNIIQKTTDLFGPDFPDFTRDTVTVIEDNHKLASPPRLLRAGGDTTIGKFVLRQVRLLRRTLRQIAVVVHAERYWREVSEALTSTDLPVRILTTRGESIPSDRPIVGLALPDHIGGQEFDAVIAVGLEQGVVPPRVQGHEGLAVTLEQYALREAYLSFTRARYQLLLVNSNQSAPSAFLEDAIRASLLTTDATA